MITYPLVQVKTDLHSEPLSLKNLFCPLSLKNLTIESPSRNFDKNLEINKNVFETQKCCEYKSAVTCKWSFRIAFKTSFSNEHWKYAGKSWSNSDENFFQNNPPNEIDDSYEFMKKCDPNDSSNPRCSVWRVIFPSNADGIENIFDIKACFRLWNSELATSRFFKSFSSVYFFISTEKKWK